jgi:hypothetical protein
MGRVPADRGGDRRALRWAARAFVCAVATAAWHAGPQASAVGTSWGLVCPHAGSDASTSTQGEALLEAWSAIVQNSLLEQGYTAPESFGGGGEECSDFQQAVVVFDRPREEVLGMLIQTHRQDEFLPSLRRVDSVERSAGHSVDRHEMKILFTKLRYHVRNQWSVDDWMIWWSLDQGRDNDILALDGYWQLYPLGDDRTLAIYASRVNVGSLIPKSVQKRLGKKKLSQSLDYFRQWVNSDGSYRP